MKHTSYILGITGASGSAYALRTARTLLDTGAEVRVVATDMGRQVLEYETGISLSGLEREMPGILLEDNADLFSPIASGSHPWTAMVVAPCSMSTLGRLAGGITTDLLTRAADVSLKQGRPLILVPRETPLTPIHLQNMLTLARCGARILPAMPGFYGHPRTLEDLVDFVSGKILDALGVENTLTPWWDGPVS